MVAGLRLPLHDCSITIRIISWGSASIVLCLTQYARVALRLRNHLTSLLLSECCVEWRIRLACYSPSIKVLPLGLVDLKDGKLSGDGLSLVWRAIIVFCLHSRRFLVIHLLLCFILFFRKCVELLRLGERSAPWLTVLAFKLLRIIEILVRLHHAPNVRKRQSSRDFRCCQSLSVGFNSW